MAIGRDLTTVGGRIREARELWSWNHRDSPAMTQARLGELVGVHQTTVSEWEANERPLAVDTVALIATILEVPAEWIAFRQGEPRAQPTGTLHPLTGTRGENAEPVDPSTGRSRRRRES
jgi:transcriptional regulator with XRE-family HTH domain